MRWFGPINRALLTLLLVMSWLVTTSHCSLAAATSAPATSAAEEAGECPMHSSKSAQQPAPTKKNGCADLFCCKNLPAAKPLPGVFVSKPPIISVFVDRSNHHDQLDLKFPIKQAPVLDTGPPSPDNFIELVLQRSIPAHAPPVS